MIVQTIISITHFLYWKVFNALLAIALDLDCAEKQDLSSSIFMLAFVYSKKMGAQRAVDKKIYLESIALNTK